LRKDAAYVLLPAREFDGQTGTRLPHPLQVFRTREKRRPRNHEPAIAQLSREDPRRCDKLQLPLFGLDSSDHANIPGARPRAPAPGRTGHAVVDHKLPVFRDIAFKRIHGEPATTNHGRLRPAESFPSQPDSRGLKQPVVTVKYEGNRLAPCRPCRGGKQARPIHVEHIDPVLRDQGGDLPGHRPDLPAESEEIGQALPARGVSAAPNEIDVKPAGPDLIGESARAGKRDACAPVALSSRGQQFQQAALSSADFRELIEEENVHLPGIHTP